MANSFLIVIYSSIIVCVSVVSATVPAWRRLSHTHMQLVMSFVSGLLLGIAVFHLLPHGLQEIGGLQHVDDAVLWLMAGMLSMFMLLRVFHFHQHDSSGLDHNHQHALDDCALKHNETSPYAWLGALAGLTVHTLVDGVALAAAVSADAGEHVAALAGVGVFLAILLHKPLDAITIASLMSRAGWSPTMQRIIVTGFVLMIPLGALLFLFGASLVSEPHVWVGSALMFSCGVFLCIALSDLLPELQFHQHDKMKLTLFLLAGLLLSYSITGIEPAYHGH